MGPGSEAGTTYSFELIFDFQTANTVIASVSEAIHFAAHERSEDEG
jgi:hypothetical protein